jgi:hypothetical protein
MSKTVKKSLPAKSRDPFKDSPKSTKKISVCSVSVDIKVGKKNTKKKLGDVYLKVKRYACPYFDYYHQRTSANIEYTFNVMVKEKKSKRHQNIGVFYTRTHDVTGYAMITSSELDEGRYFGIGVGKKVYERIADFFGVLESDPNGSTSKEAKRVWRSMKARRLKQGRFRVVSTGRVKYLK